VSIKRNSLYGLLGFALPSAVMLVAYPVLVHHLGTERFGIYFLATSIGGAVAFLDFGITSAACKYVAEDLAKGDHKAVAETIVTSFAFYGGLGIFGAALIWLLSPWLVWLFSIEAALQAESILVFRLAAIQLVASLLISNLISVFKGMQRFDQSTLALSSLSVLTYGGAMAGVTLFDIGLVGVTLISLSANLVVLSICIWRSLALCRNRSVVLGAVRPSLSALRRMFGFGIAVSAHTTTALFFLQGQRLLVGALINPAAVAIYVLAVTAASKAHALVNAATEVMFPLSSEITNPIELRRVYLRMLLGSGVVAALILGPLAFLAEQILTVWVGPDLAHKATPLMRVFAVSFFFVALSPAPFHMVNGFGRPWFNVLFDVSNVLMAVAMLLIFALDGISLADFAWAVAIANVVTAFMFQASVEILIWRRGLLASKPFSETKV
jgi:O-antigen/teichoic acid export membrane protein